MSERKARLAKTRAKLARLKTRKIDRVFARDGTPQLTYEEAVGDHAKPLSRKDYGTNSWFSRPHCDLCPRRMANMYDHLEDHESGRLDDDGIGPILAVDAPRSSGSGNGATNDVGRP